MAAPSVPGIGRRKLPGTERDLSELTVLVDPPMASPPSLDERVVRELRNARRLGVTTFDVADARFPSRAERLIADAFPEPDSGVTVIVGRSVGSLAREKTARGRRPSPPDLEVALEESLDQSRRRLAPVSVSVVEWNPSHEPESEAGTREPGMPAFSNIGKDVRVALRLSATGVPPPEATGGSSGLFSGGLSLLERDLVARFETSVERTYAHLIARDPFSDGRLDGSRFAAATTLSRPGTGPVELRRLQADFDPVIALGFLTQHRQRTLAQAALRYALDWRWVVTTVIPLPAPERFGEIFGFASSAPFSDEERTRLGLLK